MSKHRQPDRDPLALMRRADPLRDPRLETLAGLDTDSALRAILAQAEQETEQERRAVKPSDPRNGRARTRRTRRALQLATAGVTVTAAAVIAISSTGSGGGVAPARAATLAVQVRHALAGTPGGILEVKAQSSIRKSSANPFYRQTIDYWRQNDAPHDSLDTETDQHGTSITAEHNGQLEYYDQATNTISVMTPTPAVEAATGPSPKAQALAMLAQRGTTVDREATYDGQPAIELTSTGDGLVTTMYLARGSYTPLEYLQVSAPGSGSYFRQMQYQTYTTLTGAQAKPALVSLTAQHTTATIIHQDSAAWNQSEARLDP
jgi:hypothetical protein